MASALRLKLQPLPSPASDRTVGVEGLRLELLRRGGGTSQAQAGSKVDAELEFHFAEVGDPLGQPKQSEKFAVLKGQLELRGPSKQPIFINGPDAEGLPGLIEYVKPLKPEVRPANRSRPKRKALRLEFDVAAFEAMMDPLFANSNLILPEIPDGVLFIEVSAKLSVGGAAEAETDQNDRLDVVMFGGVGALVPTTSVGFSLKFAGDAPPPAPVAFKLEDPEGGVHEGKTNALGEGFVDGIKPGPSKLTFTAFAPGDWGADPKAGAQGSQHKAAKGEDVPQIAAKKGFFDVDALFSSTDNDSLRETRPNMNQLVEGDQLALPPKEAEPESVPSGVLTPFTLASRPVQRLRLVVQSDTPFSYVLSVGGATFRSDHEGSALIEHEVPVSAQKGKLKITPAGGKPLEWDVSLGTLEPVTTVKGQQARLQNLGFDPKGVDGKVGKNTKAATAAFQRFCGLEPTGDIDEATQAELLARHDEAEVEASADEASADDGETAVA